MATNSITICSICRKRLHPSLYAKHRKEHKSKCVFPKQGESK